jgi:hypothetical protein
MLIWLDLMASLIRLVLIGLFFSLSFTNIFSYDSLMAPLSQSLNRKIPGKAILIGKSFIP